MVHVNGQLVLGYTHQDIVTMFQSIEPGEDVCLHMCRGYALPFDPNDPNTEIVTTIAVSKPPPGVATTHTPPAQAGAKAAPRNAVTTASQRSAKSMPDVTSSSATPEQDERQPPDVVTTNVGGGAGVAATGKVEQFSVAIVRGSMGFGFTIADGPFGQRVKQILDRPRCKTLQENDVIVEIDGIRVKEMPHPQCVQVLKECPVGSETRLLIQRGGERCWGLSRELPRKTF